jgi:hypothetical protein
MITDQDVKALSGPDAKARANGDPDGSLTGTINDITIADPVTDKTPKAKGLTVGDIASQVGQNKIAINFVWTLVTGFLVKWFGWRAAFALPGLIAIVCGIVFALVKAGQEPVGKRGTEGTRHGGSMARRAARRGARPGVP